MIKKLLSKLADKQLLSQIKVLEDENSKLKNRNEEYEKEKNEIAKQNAKSKQEYSEGKIERDNRIGNIKFEIAHKTDVEKISIFKRYLNGIKIDSDNNMFDEFVNVNEIKEWVVPLYKEWSEELKKLQSATSTYHYFLDELYDGLSSLEVYAGFEHRSINKYLRNFYTGNLDYVETIKKRITEIEFLFLTTPKIDRNIVVYRYVDEDTFLDIIYQFATKGYINVDKAFLSTTLRADIHLKNGNSESYMRHNCMLRIFVKKGCRAIYTSLIAGREFEYEMLFPRNSYFKLKSLPYYNKELDKIMIDLEYRNDSDFI